MLKEVKGYCSYRMIKAQQQTIFMPFLLKAKSNQASIFKPHLV